jgi:uncharacterized protein
MDIIDIATANLTSPAVLAFVLGMLAVAVKSDLRMPDALYSSLTIYLLLAIGLKGGVELSKAEPGEVWLPALAAVAIGMTIPDVSYEGFLPTLLAIMEFPGIIVALALARSGAGDGGNWREALRETLSGRSIVLLAGGLLIGLVTGPDGMEQVSPFFVAPFVGVLTLFLLELGMTAARRLPDVAQVGAKLIGFAVVTPIALGTVGVLVGTAAGLSLGGSTVLGVLAASASYIAAPAAVRVALPEANPGLYLTASLAITFPFNLVAGIPLYYSIAKVIH